MDTYELETRTLKTIAHPVRLRILNALRAEEECVCHLTALVKQRQAYVSQQLMFLRQADLIEDRRDGLRVHYRIKHPQIVGVLAALNVFVGAERPASEANNLPACPCPKCERARRGEEGERYTFKSLVQVAPTADVGAADAL